MLGQIKRNFEREMSESSVLCIAKDTSPENLQRSMLSFLQFYLSSYNFVIYADIGNAIIWEYSVQNMSLLV